MKIENSSSQSDEGTPTEQEEGTERSYAAYSSTELSFDPMKELNLPASYEEVTARFRRLQGSRAMEVLN